MGRIFKANMLLPDERKRLDETIRQHHYCQFDIMRATLKTNGISLSRSSLHRYAQNLAQRDGTKCQDKNITVVVLVSRATGRTTTILTATPSAKIESLIAGLNAQT